MSSYQYPWPSRYPYATINLKQSYRSILIPGGAAVNYPTHSLYNPGPSITVVRSLSLTGATGALGGVFAVQQGPLGSVAGSVYTPLWAGLPTLPVSQHSYIDNATVLAACEILQNLTVTTRFLMGTAPIQVLPPGWSFSWQQGAKVGTVTFSWIWEELAADDPVLVGGP